MKKFSLQNMELAQAAVQDAVNFGLTASIEEKDGQISVAYECSAPCAKETTVICWDDIYSVMRSVSSEYEYQLKWLREDIQSLRNSFYEHKVGHIPAILDSGIMKKAIKALGLEDSYTVAVPTVWVQY